MKARSMRAPDPVQSTTVALLREQYGPRVIIPLDRVMEDYFPGVSQEHLLRRVSEGKLNLPIVRIDASQKSAKGVGLIDLAAYLDQRMEAARKECRQLCG
ncbi:pyocin activator PrtN family protein [Sphingomonas endophytica]|uniref:Pyocin activator protein PrtN n=1 Tax=Sphingomonas endophytica TaxID=869719 RepID=A0A147HTD8_9SPHN|nr:pyocin activator PrtN family protein [Sphingomonas endophytica]KTS10784.1 Pyocin activator protein PrtN [Methylobacterium radiotolerans]KTS47917.1 Pyocin activator protein PrtN [Methylobacterium radiotolerans]KTT68076.1 Pyocin activator protein PrtN [Sphingomonas endophytica]